MIDLHLGKWLGTLAGILCVVLGTLGIFIPLMPTTPFLLLAGWLFLRHSPRCNAWLLRHRWLGVYIRDYQKERGFTLRSKMRMLIILWLTIALSAAMAVSALAIRIFLVVIAIGVTIHILRLKTRERTKSHTDDDQ